MFFAVPISTSNLVFLSIFEMFKQAICEFNRLRQEALMARRDLTIHREA
jgi:hypothetical protein